MTTKASAPHKLEAWTVLALGIAACVAVTVDDLPWAFASASFGFGAFSINAGLLVLLVDRLLRGQARGRSAVVLSGLFLVKLIFIGVISYIGVSLLRVSVMYMVIGALLSLTMISAWLYVSWSSPRGFAHP